MVRKTIDETGAEVAPAPPGTLAVADKAAVLEAARALLDLVPDATDDDGTGIIARLLEAEGWEDLNQLSKLPAGKDLVGVTMVIRAIAKRESDIEPEDDETGIRLDHYLVIDAVRSGLGTELRWQTSAPALVLPIAKLYVWGKFPATCTIRKAEKPTKRGFWPLNLEVQAVNG